MVTVCAANPDAFEDYGYSSFVADDGETLYGSFEVFWHSGGFFSDDAEEAAQKFGDEAPEAGWYWWACFPGCMPDGEPNGPFETSTLAKDNALDT